MTNSKASLLLASAAACLVAGCVTAKAGLQHQLGESVVFISEEPAALAHLPIHGQRVSVRSTYLPGGGTIEYFEGRDFVVDYPSGTLRRTPDSRLPDFCKNILFGQREFDHTKFPGFGNGGYFAFVDYSYKQSAPWPVQVRQTQFLKCVQAKLKAGKAVKMVAFGDSITAGGEASKPELIFWQRWADDLQHKYPRARITAANGATGGDSTVQGLQRLRA